MKQTILSTKQSELLENLIAAYGHIVTSDQIYEKAKVSWDQKQVVKNITTKLTANGWLIRLKRGLYAISDLSNRGFLSLSPFVIANLLTENSYVSFESALNYHGMLDQLTGKIISITTVNFKNKTVELNSMEYSFVRVQERWFFGWEKATIDNQSVRIATAEKALIDMIQFHKSKYSVDLVIEKLLLNRNSLNIERFQGYLEKMSTTTIKIFGFIFDLVNVDSSNIYSLLKNKRNTDLMFTGDKTFNAKWRLYYDEYFDKYQKS